MIITIIIFTCFGMLIGGLLSRDKWWEILRSIFAIMIGAVAGFTIGMLVMLTFSLGTMLVLGVESKIVDLENRKLVALKDINGVSGNFFLATGQVDSKEFYYLFYYELPDGGYQLSKVEAENVVIYEENRKDGYIITLGTRKTYFPVKSFWRYFVLLPSDSKVENLRYEVHIPRGTVKRNCKLDLK